MIDHMLFNRAFWINYDSKNGTVNINGVKRNTGISQYELGTRVKFTTDDSDNSFKIGDKGTIVGSLGFIAYPDIPNSLMKSTMRIPVEDYILVKLDNGKIISVLDTWTDSGEQNE